MTTLPPTTMTELENLNKTSSYYHQDVSEGSLRMQAVKEAAQELGLQSGLAAEAKIINRILEKHAPQLDNIFDFNLLLYKENILPPVIVEEGNTLKISHDGNTIRLGGHTYKILQQVRFVTTPPTWRDYLWEAFSKPELPPAALLPTNDNEKAVWKTTIRSAWQEGEKQAISIFQINLNRLVRDYTGMILYKELLVENLVSPYVMNKKYTGITGDKNQMTIDNQLWHIAVHPELQLHSKFWQPALLASDKTASQPSPSELILEEATKPTSLT